MRNILRAALICGLVSMASATQSRADILSVFSQPGPLRPTGISLVDAAVPESGRLLMFGTGLLALGHLLRRRTALSHALSTSA